MTIEGERTLTKTVATDRFRCTISYKNGILLAVHIEILVEGRTTDRITFYGVKAFTDFIKFAENMKDEI